jgi:superfamily II DNA or RNA helicase
MTNKPKKKSIIEHWPSSSFRHGQKEFLLSFEKLVTNLDVAVVVAPTGCGKTYISNTIAKYLNNTSIIFPTNALLDQFLVEFPTFPKLHKKERYLCPLFETEGHSCQLISTKYKNKVKCNPDCEYKKDRKRAFIPWVGAYNYYTNKILL